MLSQTINEFCCQYYYVHNIRHHMYDEWISFLNKIDSPVFRQALKRYFMLDISCVAIPPLQRTEAIMLAMESITQEKNRLSSCALLLPGMTEKEYFSLDDTLNHRLYIELPNIVPSLQGVNLDEVLTQKVMAMKLDDGEGDEPVLLNVC